MTKLRFDDYLKQLNDTPTPSFENPLKTGLDLSGNVFQDIQQVAGYGIAKTLAGISTPGQVVMGFFNALETDKSQYEQLRRYDQKDGKVKFQWDKLDDLFSNAGRSAIAQAQRNWQSSNLTEWGQNSLSGAELLKNLPGSLGEAFNKDDTRTKVGTAVMGFLLDMALDPTGWVVKTGKVATEGSKLFGSTKIGSTGIRDALA